MSLPPILALDVDGVLINADKRGRWSDTIEADLGLTAGSMQERFFKPHWQEIVCGKKPVRPFLAAFLEEEGAGITAETLLSYWHERDSLLEDLVWLEAQGWKARTGGHLALATNQDHARANYLLEGLGLGVHVDTMIASCDLGVAKPDPAFFRMADDRLARQVGQTVIFIDDLADNVEAARAHGWTAHHGQGRQGVLEILRGL